MNIDDIKLLVTTADWSKVDYMARSETLVEQVLQRLGDLPGKRILDLDVARRRWRSNWRSVAMT